jgi:hypothetical protein
MAWPLAAVAAIQLAVGGTVLLRTDRQVAALEARLAADPAGFRDLEAARMERVMAGFRLYKTVEIALLAAGIALCLAFPRRESWSSTSSPRSAGATTSTPSSAWARRPDRRTAIVPATAAPPRSLRR